MKKIIIITLLFSNFSTFSFDDGSDKIIKKYLKAIGGAKEWDAVKTMQIIRHQDSKYNDFLEKVSILRDKGIRHERMMGTGSPNVSGYYNGKCWAVINPQDFSLKIKAETIDSLVLDKFQIKKDSLGFININTSTRSCKKYKDGVFEDGTQIRDIPEGHNPFFSLHFFKWQTQMPWNFLDYEASGYKAIYKGDSKISIDDVSEIEMISKTGDTTKYFFDKRTSLLLRAIHKNIQLDFSSYKKIANVLFPYEVRKTITDFQFIKQAPITPHSDWYIIDQVKLNEPMDEKIFMKPKQ
jgi:hypothetical protein